MNRLLPRLPTSAARGVTQARLSILSTSWKCEASRRAAQSHGPIRNCRQPAAVAAAVGSEQEGARMMVRTIWAVVLAAGVSAGVAAQQPFDVLRAAPSAVEGQQSQQPPVPVPSAAPTVQAGDTRPIHVYIRSGL